MSYFGKYYLSGADAQRAADWIFTNNVRDTEESDKFQLKADKITENKF